MSHAVQHWRFQRLTAIILVPLCLWFVFSLATATSMDFTGASAWIKTPVHSVLLLLFILALFYHAQLGLQVVIEDYVSTEALRNRSIFLCKIVMYLSGLIAVAAVLKIASGH